MIGRATGITSGKADCNSGERPKFIDALIATNFRTPYCVKCSLFLTRICTCLKSS